MAVTEPVENMGRGRRAADDGKGIRKARSEPHPLVKALFGVESRQAGQQPTRLVEQHPGAAPVWRQGEPSEFDRSGSRRPPSMALRTNLPSASVVGTFGVTSGSAIIR